jgi:hypothetical protein
MPRLISFAPPANQKFSERLTQQKHHPDSAVSYVGQDHRWWSALPVNPSQLNLKRRRDGYWVGENQKHLLNEYKSRKGSSQPYVIPRVSSSQGSYIDYNSTGNFLTPEFVDRKTSEIMPSLELPFDKEMSLQAKATAERNAAMRSILQSQMQTPQMGALGSVVNNFFNNAAAKHQNPNYPAEEEEAEPEVKDPEDEDREDLDLEKKQKEQPSKKDQKLADLIQDEPAVHMMDKMKLKDVGLNHEEEDFEEDKNRSKAVEDALADAEARKKKEEEKDEEKYPDSEEEEEEDDDQYLSAEEDNNDIFETPARNSTQSRTRTPASRTTPDSLPALERSDDVRPSAPPLLSNIDTTPEIKKLLGEYEKELKETHKQLDSFEDLRKNLNELLEVVESNEENDGRGLGFPGTPHSAKTPQKKPTRTQNLQQLSAAGVAAKTMANERTNQIHGAYKKYLVKNKNATFKMFLENKVDKSPDEEFLFKLFSDRRRSNISNNRLYDNMADQLALFYFWQHVNYKDDSLI